VHGRAECDDADLPGGGGEAWPSRQVAIARCRSLAQPLSRWCSGKWSLGRDDTSVRRYTSKYGVAEAVWGRCLERRDLQSNSGKWRTSKLTLLLPTTHTCKHCERVVPGDDYLQAGAISPLKTSSKGSKGSTGTNLGGPEAVNDKAAFSLKHMVDIATQ
jgi:hypothetical protein